MQTNEHMQKSAWERFSEDRNITEWHIALFKLRSYDFELQDILNEIYLYMLTKIILNTVVLNKKELDRKNISD